DCPPPAILQTEGYAHPCKSPPRWPFYWRSGTSVRRSNRLRLFLQWGCPGLRTLLRLLAQGDIVGITPDGPRGPRRSLAPGVAQVAALSGAPIIPCAGCTSRRVVVGTWDRLSVPLPFGRGVVVCGPAITVRKGEWRGALPGITAALNHVAERAERLCPA